jgi:5S rRNA maturation endonuclease (ribonuclease M5)
MTPEEYFKTHGINQQSIKKFEIVYNSSKIIIPVRDEDGVTIFNKYRHLDFNPNDPSTKKFSYDQGSSASLFNVEVLKDSTYVFLTEGEFDCIRLDQEGICSISNTSGASTFKEEWLELLEGKKVYIIYDNDKAGREGAAKIHEALPRSIVIKLPDHIKDICDYFQSHTLAQFRAMCDKQVKENTLTYDQLCELIDKWLLLPDKNVIRILLATLVSHFFTTDPLWMFFVAPPSGSKTEIISTATSLPFVHMLSDLTAQTLASGMPIKKDMDPSLLMKLKDNVLIMKDFTTVLSMRHEDKMMIFAQLREVYDGKYIKTFGTGKRVEWEGRLTLIAGVTSIIDTHASVFQTMGERFIMYRVPQANDEQVALKALSKYGDEKQMRDELKEAMNKYFTSLDIPHVSEIELPHEIAVALASLASFVVKARSAIERDQFRREITFIPETEAPARLVKQLGTLIKALTVLEGRKKVSWDDYYMTLRVALDIVPSNRMRHIVALCREKIMSTAEVARITDYSRSGTEMILEDLNALQIADSDKYGIGSSTDWKIADKANNYFKKIFPVDSPNVYKIFPKDSFYSPLIEHILRLHSDKEELVETDNESLIVL